MATTINNRNRKKSRLNNPTCLVLLLLLFFSLIAFGGFESWAQAVIGIVSGILILFLVFSAFPENPVRPAALFFLVFILLLIFTTLPLPSFFVRLVSPETYRVWSISGQHPFWITLSLNRYATLKSLSLFLSAAAVFLVFTHLSERTRRQTLFFLAFLGIAAAVTGIFGFLYPSKEIYWLWPIPSGHPMGSFINRNHFAGYLNLVFFLSAGMLVQMWSEGKRLHSVFLLAGLPVMLAGIFLSLSRSGAVGFAAGLFSMLAASLIFQKTRKYFFWFVPALAIGFLLINRFGIEKVTQRLTTLQDPLSSITVQMRLATWKDTVGIFGHYPLFGTGAGTSPVVLPVYKTSFIHRYFANTENEYLELLAETGIIGFISLSLVLLFLLFRKNEMTGSVGLRAGALSAIAAGLVQAIFDFNLHMPAILLVFVLALAVFSASPTALDRPNKKLLKYGGFLLPALVFLFIFNLQQLAVEYNFFRANRVINQTAANRAAYLKMAIRYAGCNPKPFYRLGRFEYENDWKLALTEKKRLPELLTASYQTLKDGGRRSPVDWRFPYYQAWVAEKLVRLDYPEWKTRRDRDAVQAMVLNPTEYLILLNFSELYRYENPDKAELLRQKALLICPWAK